MGVAASAAWAGNAQIYDASHLPTGRAGYERRFDLRNGQVTRIELFRQTGLGLMELLAEGE